MKKHATILSEHAISEYSDVYIQRLAEAIERPDGLIECLDVTIRRLDVIIQLLADNIQPADESVRLPDGLIGEPDVIIQFNKTMKTVKK